MRDFIAWFLAVYTVGLLFAAVLGLFVRIGKPQNCKPVYADYFFLGVSRLVCEVN